MPQVQLEDQELRGQGALLAVRVQLDLPDLLEHREFQEMLVLLDKWEQVEVSVRTFLADLRDEDLDRVVEFAIGNGPKHAMRLGDLMHHAAMHGVHHRGQVALLLRSLGQVPGNFDILFYYGRPK